jgi:hypothetical protein
MAPNHAGPCKRTVVLSDSADGPRHQAAKAARLIPALWTLQRVMDAISKKTLAALSTRTPKVYGYESAYWNLVRIRTRTPNHNRP